MRFTKESTFYRLLDTRYDLGREQEAINLLDQCPHLAHLEWTHADEASGSFVHGSTALHYAANDGKLNLVRRLIELGADPNASNARWYRSVLSWAANNAHTTTITFLVRHGARVDSLDALHAAAWGGSSRGQGKEQQYAETLRWLIDAGADPNDRRHPGRQTPLAVAFKSGNEGAVQYLRSIGAAEA